MYYQLKCYNKWSMRRRSSDILGTFATREEAQNKLDHIIKGKNMKDSNLVYYIIENKGDIRFIK